MGERFCVIKAFLQQNGYGVQPGLFEPFFRTLGDPYAGYVYPQTPLPFRFDRVLSKLNALGLKLIGPPPAK